MTSVAFPHLAATSQGYVFVVSYGMSGDVGLQDLMNRIDGVSIRGENGGVAMHLAQAWYQAAETAGSGLDAFHDLNRLGWHLADSFVETVLAPPAGLRFSGFREIRWSDTAEDFNRQLDFLYAFFPGARFVLHSRAPADVAGLGWWAEQLADTVIQTLTRRRDLMDAYRERHPARGIRLDYDDYIGAPRNLMPLFDLLETPFDERLVADWMQEMEP